MKRRTRDWKYIDVKDMETSHIENCIKHIKQHWIFYVRWYAMWTEIDWDVEEDFEAEEKRLKIFNDELQRRKETWKDAEIRRLKQQISEKDETIRKQAEKLNKLEKENYDLNKKVEEQYFEIQQYGQWFANWSRHWDDVE